MFIDFRKQTRMVNLRFSNHAFKRSYSPTYTTYSERDYEYLINDCEPSVVIVSNQSQYNKIEINN